MALSITKKAIKCFDYAENWFSFSNVRIKPEKVAKIR